MRIVIYAVPFLWTADTEREINRIYTCTHAHTHIHIHIYISRPSHARLLLTFQLIRLMPFSIRARRIHTIFIIISTCISFVRILIFSCKLKLSFQIIVRVIDRINFFGWTMIYPDFNFYRLMNREFNFNLNVKWFFLL